MAIINFNPSGSFNGIEGGPKLLNNPTSLQFGPDGRLYVSEQNGAINAFTVELQNGEYVAVAQEELLLPNGSPVVQSILNHDDDGAVNNSVVNRQVTGLVVTGTPSNPTLYISSSDPRISTFNDVNLDTNSGVVTRVTWTGTEWESVDILRGLPRSEENHSVNGLVLSPDGTKLYLTVGGNTNNGAPSAFFSYTGEYALSGTVLEIDLDAIESLPVLTDAAGGQNGTSRQYVYDLPTLDDPSVANDGVRETSNGLDVAGPWGGNDGFNMAILPADAPLRVYADGFRNHYDLVLTAAGNLYTVDNGSNVNLGGNPLDENGVPTDQPGAGAATNTPNGGGTGDPEPLFQLEDGGYYGHPNPVRSNPNLPWVIYDDDGNPDASITPNTVPNLSALVPDAINIQDGFLIDPSKFTGNASRLSQSGIRVERDADPQSLINLGSSSNGLVEYTDLAFDGALEGALLVTQFNGNVTLLNLNEAGTALEPLIDPGDDGILGTADDEILSTTGIFPLVTGQSQPLDVTVGPGGTIWVAEFGPDNINVFAPSDVVTPVDPDIDGDGLLNFADPFIRDATNGTSVTLTPDQTLVWDFDANQDNNRPGPNGYGGGLTGVMINGVTDFEAFFQSPSDLPGQIIKLDNVKFTTAAGGGTTVIESVSNGEPKTNDGEYLFHTGLTIAPSVETFTVKWDVFNPANEFTGSFQQIGGYIGTGDQSNYLKFVAIQSPAGELLLELEDNDVIQSSSYIQANDLFSVPPDQGITFELEINPGAATATPTITYETGGGNSKTVSGDAVDLSNTVLLDAILGDLTVNGQSSGLAVGLLASNVGQPEADTFQAVFDNIEISGAAATADPPMITTPASVTVPENQVSAVDVDATGGAGLSFSLTGGADQGSFSIDAASGVLNFSSPPDFEMPGDADCDNVYEVEVTVTDTSNLTDTQLINVTVSDEIETPGGIPFQLEAEDIVDVTGYQVANNSAASGGQILSLLNAGVSQGTAAFDFTGATGQYDVILGAFDESDGQSSFNLSQNGSSVGSVVLSQDLGGAAPNASTRVERTIASGIPIELGDRISVTGVLSQTEYARLDFIRFEPSDGTSPPGGIPIRLEAEDASDITTFRTENIGVASGGQALSLVGGGSLTEVGSATFDFGAPAGIYDVKLGSFDESDGQAQLVIELNDFETGNTTQIGLAVLDADLPGILPNAQNIVGLTVASGINLTPGDTLTVTGAENGSEYARLDYVELVPVI